MWTWSILKSFQPDFFNGNWVQRDPSVLIATKKPCFEKRTPESYCLSDLFTQFLIYHSILYQQPQYHATDFLLIHKADFPIVPSQKSGFLSQVSDYFYIEQPDCLDPVYIHLYLYVWFVSYFTCLLLKSVLLLKLFLLLEG
jgi:hypothetical protein